MSSPSRRAILWGAAAGVVVFCVIFLARHLERGDEHVRHHARGIHWREPEAVSKSSVRTDEPLLLAPNEAREAGDPDVAVRSDRLRGRVTGDDGHPVAGVRVVPVPGGGRTFWPSDTAEPGALTDAAGGFDVAAGDLVARPMLLFIRNGLVPQLRDKADFNDMASLGVCVVEMSSGDAIRGHIRDVWGAPIPGARVEVLGTFGPDVAAAAHLTPGVRAARDFQSCASDAKGRFEAHGITSFPVRVRASCPGYRAAGDPIVVDSTGADPVVVMMPLYRAGVRALDARTRLPVKNVRFHWKGAPGTRDVPPPPDSSPTNQYPYVCEGEQWFTFASDKSFTSRDAPRVLRIHALAPGYVSADTEVRLTPMTGPDAPSCETVLLEPLGDESEWGALCVQLELPGWREPVAGVWLLLRAAGDPTTREVTALYADVDEQRRATVQLPMGDYEVKFEALRGWPSWRSRVPMRPVSIRSRATTTIRYELNLAALSLKIGDEASDVVPSFQVAVYGSAGMLPVFAMHSDALDDPREAGAFLQQSRFDGRTMRLPIVPGNYTVVVDKPGFERLITSVALERGDEKSLEFVLREK